MNSAARLRKTYSREPLDRLLRTEFYIWEEALERWASEGMPVDTSQEELFSFDPHPLTLTGVDLGWCEPPYLPAFEELVIEDQGDYEIIQDIAGRHLKVFKGKRHGFMPVYLKHAVATPADWYEDIAPRLDHRNPARWQGLQETLAPAIARRGDGSGWLRQGIIGGYMYLRAMVGPTEICYAFIDEPEMVRAMMDQWFLLNDSALEKIQALTPLDELFLAEDICYNKGPLISPDLMREYLLPYYDQLIQNARARQSEHLFFGVDTDGDARPVIDLYQGVGVEIMLPFEVASGCDVVAIGEQHPDLVMWGGIDKRVMAEGKAAIDAHLEHIMPAMVKRGGYIPMCDHGVPDNVSYENYLYYRRRICELDH